MLFVMDSIYHFEVRKKSQSAQQEHGIIEVPYMFLCPWVTSLYREHSGTVEFLFKTANAFTVHGLILLVFLYMTFVVPF